MSVKTFTGSNIRRNIVGCAENCRVVVVRLGKIKCAANWVGLWVALQPFLFCEGIAKRLCRNLHCRSVYVCRLMVALSGLRVADNVPALGEVANFGADYFLSKIKFLAKSKLVFTTKFAILPNACYQQFFIFPIQFIIFINLQFRFLWSSPKNP